jgi:uncharacterized protein YjbJ (UPF0337 family)
MSCHQLIGNLKQVKEAVGEGRGKLTAHNNVDVIAGKRDILPGKIQEGHGIACEQAERGFKDCEASLR